VLFLFLISRSLLRRMPRCLRRFGALGLRPQGWLAGALWLGMCGAVWPHTVLENAALLGLGREQIAAALPDAQPVRAPRRLSSGALGSLRVADAPCEGAHFEQTLYFNHQKLAQMDLVLLNPASGPGSEDAMAHIQEALLQSLRVQLGPELAAFAAAPGAVTDTASWVSADADVMLFRSGRPEHPSLRIVIKQRQLADAGEL
jgi:hypothetical protein